MKTILTILTAGLIVSVAVADSQKCVSGALITSQTFNFFAVGPETIQKNLEKNAYEFCNTKNYYKELNPRQLNDSIEVYRSAAPSLLQFEACFACD